MVSSTRLSEQNMLLPKMLATVYHPILNIFYRRVMGDQFRVQRFLGTYHQGIVFIIYKIHHLKVTVNFSLPRILHSLVLFPFVLIMRLAMAALKMERITTV